MDEGGCRGIGGNGGNGEQDVHLKLCQYPKGNKH